MPTQYTPKASRRRRSSADPIAPTTPESQQAAPTPVDAAHKPVPATATEPSQVPAAEQRDRLRVTVPKSMFTELKNAYTIDAGPGVSWSDWITELLGNSLHELHAKHSVAEFTGPGVLNPGRPRSQ